MIREVLRIGSPTLREPSKPVPIESLSGAFFQTMIDDMLETMYHTNGAGISAPQIGHNFRIMAFEVTQNPRYPKAEPVPLTILINPSFETLSTEKESGYEGCLSVGELRGLVPRYLHIRYKGFDRDGSIIEREVTQFHARVFQHEFDHLDGILFVDRVEDTSSFGFMPELNAAGKI
ncbi:MAG: peptide deformylase [Gammaproteobacteria bacterium]